jgi:hypothetical protein
MNLKGRSHMKPMQLAQGDVLLVPCLEIPKRAKEVERDKGRVVLAYGEVTGHAHAIADRKARLMRFSGVDYLEVGGKVATLKHEEHGEIEIPQGTYRVVKQREYAFGQGRQVAD